MMLIPDPLLFAIALADTGAVLFLLVYYVITLSDLECDYLNAQQCCSRLNTWVLPKLIAHVFLAALFLIHSHYTLFLINLPMVLWMAWEIVSVPQGNLGVFDPTEIHNRGQLQRHMSHCMINLGCYMILFFIYLYCMIIALLKGDPIKRSEEDQYEF